MLLSDFEPFLTQKSAKKMFGRAILPCRLWLRKRRIFINVFRLLRTQSVRNKKPPALRVGNKRLYQKTHLSVTIKLFKLIVKKRKVSKMANKTNSLSSTTWMCKYHIAFIPKYRRKAIYGQYRESLQEIIRTLCRYKGVEILEGHMMPDHVHLLLSIPPKREK